MSALDSIIEKINASTDKGTLFEKLCLCFLRNDPTQQQRLSDVWPWREWPLNNGEPDTGIDIVARVRDSESYCAVQCKFREDDSTITKAEIDSFLALSSKEIFSARIIFTLTDNFNTNARNAITNQNPPVTVITLESFRASSIDWEAFSFESPGNIRYKKNEFRQYQDDAINAVLNGLVSHGRGKLIMACGTGKTYVSLRIAEEYSGRGGLVLVLVPSISLMSQSVTAWNNSHHRNIPLVSLPVCSDVTAGYDDEDMRPEDLAFKPDTDSGELVSRWKNAKCRRSSLCVIFSTYQSLNVIHDAQEKGLPRFDLVICDEAHRTAGMTPKDGRESLFRKVHDDSFIHARKRLYMTATPKIFGDNAKSKAKENYSPLYSMDDEKIYGPEFFSFSFSDAIDAGQLSDYKVIVFTYNIDPNQPAVRKIDDKHSITMSDTAKIIGIRRALSKELYPADYESMKNDLQPMKSAVIFTNTINASETFAKAFGIITKELSPLFENEIKCETHHIDGTFSASRRAKFLSQLHDVPEGSCRIISNARCLSEGVDVPALDAIAFLSPKSSEIDIVQSAGRVMRKAPGKKFGYVIIPVAVHPGSKPHEELDKNEEWKTVWRVLKAMRSHDNTFQSAVINELRFTGKSKRVVIVPPIGNDPENFSQQLEIQFSEWDKAITAKIVEKCGDREYWDKWTRDLTDIAAEITAKIREAIKNFDARIAFDSFLHSLRSDINKQITEDDAVDMLTQHMITQKVFDAFFSSFSKLNPVSAAMNSMTESLRPYKVDERLAELQNFYSHVYKTVQQIAGSDEKYNFMHHLYEDFFRAALPKAAQKLGIVYTPPEIVDFILRSADWALREKLSFTEGLSSPGVRILDPFSGTGKFTARLITSGLISQSRIGDKYESKIFANEILPLAYYISAVNIESAFAEYNRGKADYLPFQGMILTDTFTYDTEATKTIAPMFHDNSLRAYVESETGFNVIIGNPPYSVGQKSANDNNKNTEYPKLRGRIKDSYSKRSKATLKKSLYDSYILAFRWASDRLRGQPRGVICFVTNGSFLDSNSADGMRKCLAEEFRYIYVFNLRGDQRTENWREEGDKIFDQDCQCPIAVTLLVKDERRKGEPCEIYYYEVRDGMEREAKLAELSRLESFGKMSGAGLMREITPNDRGDWISKKAESYDDFFRLGNKREADKPAIFGERYSSGVVTGRDAWCYNFSRSALIRNMTAMIEVYNSERERWNREGSGRIEGFVTNDKHKISWGRATFRYARKNTRFQFSEEAVRVSLYRPYVKEYLYFDSSRCFNEEVYSIPSIFPEHDTKNLLICIHGTSSKKDFSVLMTDTLLCFDAVDKSQCFPLYWYTRGEGLFDTGLVRHDGIGDSSLAEFRTHYGDRAITKEDIFYYVYGVLSSREYAARFGNDAKKVLARVPFVKDIETFREFSRAGRELGALHVNYESAEEWPVDVRYDGVRITKLTVDKKDKDDKSTWEICGPGVTVREIPACAWEYRVNGRSALEWIADRYRDDVDKASGIRNDCNEWNGADYVLRLIRRVITVSAGTVRILEGLPEMGV